MISDEIRQQFLDRLKTGGPTYIPNDQTDLRRMVREMADQGKVFLDDTDKMDRVTLPVRLEEGERCPFKDCDGIIGWDQEPCYCHAGNAPCSACENAHLSCCECGFDGYIGGHVERWENAQEKAKFAPIEGSW